MYVRKYDPPLFIDTNKDKQSAFLSILGMNSDVTSFPTDASIMKHVKENVFKPEEALVNTLKYYRG